MNLEFRREVQAGDIVKVYKRFKPILIFSIRNNISL